MRNNKGFSLIQILIAAGMLSGLFVVSLKMMKNQSQIGKSSSEEFEMSYAFDDMRNLLADPSICRDTLKEVNAYEPTSLEGIKTKELEDGFDYQPFNISGKRYGQNNLKIKSLDYVVGDKESNADDGEAFIVVAFEKSKSAIGDKIVEKRMKIHLQLNENDKVSSCFALPGVNFKEDIVTNSKKIKVWHTVPGTQNIYTDFSNIKVNTYRGSKSMGLSLKGKLKLGRDTTRCTSEKKGSLRFQAGGLELCSKNGMWRNILNPRRRVVKKEISLITEGRSQIKTTNTPFSICSIVDSDLYGARCKSKRLNDNLWELSLLYDRGATSKCIFHCFR